MRTTYLNMKSLIEKKFYPTVDAVMSYLELFVMMGRMTQDEYMELALLATAQYAPTEPVDPASSDPDPEK